MGGPGSGRHSDPIKSILGNQPLTDIGTEGFTLPNLSGVQSSVLKHAYGPPLALTQLRVHDASNAAAAVIQQDGTGASDGTVLRLIDASQSTNLIQIPMQSLTHYPHIKWRDFTNDVPVITLTAHEDHPTLGDHRHFTIYGVDETYTTLAGRFYLEFGRIDPIAKFQSLDAVQINNTDNDDLPTRQNRTHNADVLQVNFRNKVTDGNTYNLTGNVARFKTEQTQTSGTINNSVDVLLLEQQGKTGRGLVIDQDTNSASNTYSISINSANAGAGNGAGIDITLDNGGAIALNTNGIIVSSGAFFLGTTAPTFAQTVASGATFVSGGALWFKGSTTQTQLAPA